mgnify:CR=1 FL=1
MEIPFVAPEPQRGTVCLESANPMVELPFYSDNMLTKGVKPSGNWMSCTGGVTLWMPLGVEGKGSYRVTFTAETNQPGPRTLAFHMREAIRNMPVSPRLQTVAGQSGPMRYSIDFVRKAADGRLCLSAAGVSGRFRISDLRVERF